MSKHLLRNCEKIDYIDVMDLDFIREDCHDEIWKNEHGFDYFIVSRQIGKAINFTWEPDLKKVKMQIVHPQNGDILDEFPVKNLNTLTNLIDFFETAEIPIF